MDIHGYIHGYPRKICGYGYGYGWEISYPRQACLMACHVVKFHGVTPPHPKVIGANTLILQANFCPPFEKKLLREPPFTVGYRLAKLGHSVARVKISGRSTP